jgi:hypothetical protein
MVDREEEWEVEQLLDSQMHKGELQYLVVWKGWDNPDWEPFENIGSYEE